MRFAAADVRDEDQVQAAVEAATELGALRVVVNCAGVGTPGRVISKRGVLPLEDFRTVIDINLVGTFNVLRLTAATMIDNEPLDGDRGLVIMTASVAAFDGQIGQAAYAASKGGVVGLTLSAARDLADKAIRVMTIAPGVMETPMMAGLPGETKSILEGAGAASGTAWPSRGVRHAGVGDHRESAAQWRSHPPGRRPAHATALDGSVDLCEPGAYFFALARRAAMSRYASAGSLLGLCCLVLPRVVGLLILVINKAL